MKFEEFLMRPSEGHVRRLALENEVEELQERLEGEMRLRSVLRWAMKGPVLSFHCLPPQLPIKVRVLMTELAVAEEQIIWLERKVRRLKLNINHNRKPTSQRKMHQNTTHQTIGDRSNKSHTDYASHHGNSELNRMSPGNKSCSSSKFNGSTTFLLPLPWRRNAMCGV